MTENMLDSRRWAPHIIRTTSATVDDGRLRLATLTDRLADVGQLPGWAGAAADAARAAVGVVVRDLRESVLAADSVRRALDVAADDIESVLPFGLAGSPLIALARLLVVEDTLVDALAVIDPDPRVTAAAHDAANRQRLVTERVRLMSEAERLRNRLTNNMFGGWFSNADAGLEQTEKRLQALDSIQAVLDKGNRQLLVLDNTGEKETIAAIGIGDLDSAANVAVFVPGLGSTVQGNMDKYDADVEGIVGPGSAGVTWLGYEAPQLGWGLLDPDTSVLSGRSADSAGDALASFLDEIPADAHTTVVGHSYGSVVAADALTSGTTVDDVVLMGSPGVGVGEAHEIGAEHVYVLESPTDVVADTAWLGRDPNMLPGVEVLASTGANGHGQYLDSGTTSAANVAAVVAGTPTTPARAPIDAGDVVRVLLGVVF
ncbi:alpha/beta hydrolase [Actinomycetes bacterium M1A6_2h]